MNNEPENTMPHAEPFRQEPELDMIDLIFLGMRYKYLIFSLLLLGAVAGFLVEKSMYVKLYSAQSVVLLDKPSSAKQNAWQIQEFARNIVRNSYKSVIHSQETLQTILDSTVPDPAGGRTVAEMIALSPDNDGVACLKELIKLDFEKNTCILRITVKTPNPHASQFIVSELINQLNQFYNKQLDISSHKELEHAKSSLAKAETELATAKQELLHLYETNKLLTDPDFKKNNEIPARLKHEEQRLLQAVADKTALHSSISAKYNEMRFSDTSDVSQVTIIERPALPIRPVAADYSKKIAIGAFGGGALAGMFVFSATLSALYRKRYLAANAPPEENPQDVSVSESRDSVKPQHEGEIYAEQH